MFLPDHFLKWVLSAILAANVAEAEREIYSSEEDDEEEEEKAKDIKSSERKSVRRTIRRGSPKT